MKRLLGSAALCLLGTAFAQPTTTWVTEPGGVTLALDSSGDADGNSYLVNGNYAFGGGSLLRKLAQNGVTLGERSHPMAGLRAEVGSDGAPVVSGLPSSGALCSVAPGAKATVVFRR